MKRLLRVGIDSFIFSFVPIISWFALGLLVDSDLSNVFTLTYPLQFILAMLKNIFGTGANICSIKEKDENHILSGMTSGIIIGFIVFGFFVINIDCLFSFYRTLKKRLFLNYTYFLNFKANCCAPKYYVFIAQLSSSRIVLNLTETAV